MGYNISERPFEKPPLNKPDLVSKINDGNAVTDLIDKNKLSLYKKAALTTGCRVEEIAQEGEVFPYLEKQRFPGSHKAITIYDRVVGENEIGIVIYKRKGSEDGFNGYIPFWDQVRELERNPEK